MRLYPINIEFNKTRSDMNWKFSDWIHSSQRFRLSNRPRFMHKQYINTKFTLKKLKVYLQYNGLEISCLIHYWSTLNSIMSQSHDHPQSLVGHAWRRQFIFGLCALLRDGLQFWDTRRLLGRDEEGWCNLNPWLQISSFLCHGTWREFFLFLSFTRPFSYGPWWRF